VPPKIGEDYSVSIGMRMYFINIRSARYPEFLSSIVPFSCSSVSFFVPLVSKGISVKTKQQQNSSSS